MASRRIVIVGGGFAASACAGTLLRELRRDSVEIVLFSLENHLVFTPLLADVVGATVKPLDATVPLRLLLPGVFCRTEEVVDIDREQGEVVYRDEDGRDRRLAYDHVVLACGTISNLEVVPGMAKHAFPLKTIVDAVELRGHIMGQMERAETARDPERRRQHLSFVVVGGGYSGVESAGEINDLVRSSARHFQTFTAEDVHVTIVHSQDELLKEIGGNLRQYAHRYLERSGVCVRLKARAQSVSAEGVVLTTGELIRGATVVCTIGTSIAPMVERLQALKVKGRLLTDPDLRLRGESRMWAIGDCASIVNAYDGLPSPTTGQFAEQQGRRCAKNIVRALRERPGRPFSFKPLGQLCSLGGHAAVAEFLGLRLSGFVAWLLWRFVYLSKLPVARQLEVGFGWLWLLLFPRDLTHVRALDAYRAQRLAGTNG